MAGLYFSPIFISGSRDGHRWEPATFQSRFDGQLGQAGNLNPFSQRLRDTVCCDEMISTRISRLFLFGAPSHITRGIRAIVIYAVNRVRGRRAHSNVSMELSNGSSPFIAHGNSSATVTLVCGMFWIRASLKDARPCRVDAASAKSMSGRRSPNRFLLQTAATLSRLVSSSSKSVRKHCAGLAAIASTKPFDPSVPALTNRFDGKTTYAHTS